jgi:hypothetical protein
VNSGSGEVLVRVYDQYLFTSDLEGVIPAGASARDSLTAVRTFIQNWVDQELLVRKAEENLPEERQDFSRSMEEYRQSLIIYEYEKMLVHQELDTNISRDALQEYYDSHKSNFRLNDDIIDLKYLKIHTDSPYIREFRQLINSDEPGDMDSLALYSSKYASSFSLMSDNWLQMDEASELLPLENYSYRDFRNGRRYLEQRDSVFLYMMLVRDYKPADSIPPLSFVEPNIEKIILNRRKNELVKGMRRSLLQDAIEQNQVEIY